MNNQIVAIKPDILIWARKRLNLDVPEVSYKLKQKPVTITNWEKGKTLPSLTQLEKLAYEVYKIPLATFFLPDVPNEPLMNQQFRTIPENEISKLHPSLMVLVKEAQYYQEVFKELFDGLNPVKEPILKFSGPPIISNLQATASSIRNTLNINLKTQASFKSSTEAFKYYRNALENNGIFVFQQTLKDICRGYSLFDKEFPLIIINSSEISDTGKNFTLFHELCHLLHTTGGISNEFTYQSENIIEISCNKLASLILVDNNELSSELETLHVKPYRISDDQLKTIAKRFRVSQEVILRRLLDQELTSKEHYEVKRKEWLSSLPIRKKTTGGNHFNIKISQLSHQYSSSVLTKMYSGSLSRYQAAELLKTKINYLATIEKLVFK
jgi:Zn-dependent peptidase ImmA (M78 family)